MLYQVSTYLYKRYSPAVTHHLNKGRAYKYTTVCMITCIINIDMCLRVNYVKTYKRYNANLYTSHSLKKLLVYKKFQNY